jgi:perosamine synthetase
LPAGLLAAHNNWARIARLPLAVPFFRPSIGDREIAEVVDVLKSGWLTTGPRVRQLESDLAAFVGASHAVAVNSATAALHLAVEALGLGHGDAVLVPTMTFAASAEVVRYMDAVPVLVDCDPITLNIDLADAAVKLHDARTGELGAWGPLNVRGIIPVHVGGLMCDVAAVNAFAKQEGLWVLEDAAHALPAAWRSGPDHPWVRAGDNTADVTCFSFYANKTITTGEGGVAVTADAKIADRMRLMSLHGLSRDAWNRYSGGNWDYRIVAPGFKYNLTDIAAAIGIHQLARADEMRAAREEIAAGFRERLAGVGEIELPPLDIDRIQSWHLFAIRLRLNRLRVNRARFIEAMTEAGVGSSVHWRPLHLHPYYEQLGWMPDHCPVAALEWERLISLPIFPSMTAEEQSAVTDTIADICARFRR